MWQFGHCNLSVKRNNQFLLKWKRNSMNPTKSDKPLKHDLGQFKNPLCCLCLIIGTVVTLWPHTQEVASWNIHFSLVKTFRWNSNRFEGKQYLHIFMKIFKSVWIRGHSCLKCRLPVYAVILSFQIPLTILYLNELPFIVFSVSSTI